MAYDAFTMGFSCLLLVPGVIFMAKNKAVAMNAVKEAGLEKSVNDEALALAAYYLFLVGMVVFELGTLALSLTLGITPVLAIAAGTAGAISILLTMAITKHSITGIPGITGPPMPARVMLILMGVILTVNTILHFVDGDIDGSEWIKFGGVYLMSLVIPHGIAFKHRKEGWSTPAMV